MTDDTRLAGVIKTLTVVGTLVYIGWVLFLFRVVFQAVRVDESQLGGMWDQRIERLGFITLPPNVPVLGLGAACAVTATWLAGPTQELGLAILLRLVRWSANLLVVVGATWVVSTIVNDVDGPDELGAIAFRLGGVVMSAAVSYLCLSAGRTAPGG